MGLIACGVLGMLLGSFPYPPVGAALGIVGELIYAAAVLLFAVGLAREASVVARRPLGVWSLVVVALWPLAARVVAQLLAAQEPEGGPASMTFGYIALVVPVGAGLIAAVQIARAGVVPSPWRWAPMWALAAHVAAFVLAQLLILALGAAEVQLFAGVLSMLGVVAFLLGTLGLGVIALVCAARLRPDSVAVFRSADRHPRHRGEGADGTRTS